MPHEIFGERFVSLRVPAWHNIGLVAENEMTCMEALAATGADDIDVEMAALYVRIENGHGPEFIEAPGYRAALRAPTPDDNEYRVFNIVSDEYVPVTMRDIAEVADKAIGRPVETLGILGEGERGFTTFALPSIDVYGDEVEMYLGATYSFTSAASVEVWPLRVVCQNTLRLAQARARVAYRIVHDAQARERMGEWLAQAYRDAAAQTEMLKGLFIALADARAGTDEANLVATAAFPDPKAPRDNAPPQVMKARWERWEYRRDRRRLFRAESLRLFNGAGTGMDVRATQGTLYGVVQAVAEVENYRNGSMKDGREAEAVAEDLLFGRRGEAIMRAATRALEVAGVAALS